MEPMSSDPPSQAESAGSVTFPFSREKAVECPHSMALMGYIGRAYGLPKFYSRSNDLLYHYTDGAGLLGIVSSNRLWATDTNFLNDPSEGQFFPRTMLEIMRQKAGGLTTLEERIVASIERGLEQHATAFDTFSVSFCCDGDLLSQWRSYGYFGSGYAIGFEAKEFPEFQIGQLVDVQYGVSNISDIALEMLSIFVESNSKWEAILERFCSDAAHSIRFWSLSFKNIGYKEERESRILVRLDDKPDMFEVMRPLRFRARGADIVPYVALAPRIVEENRDSPARLLRKGEHPPVLPIRRIVTGPGVDYARNKIALERLLASKKYENVEIVSSAIPFRSTL